MKFFNTNKENKKTNDLEKRRMGIKEQFSNPAFVYAELMKLFQEGDFDSTTDLIAAYVANSRKYKNQEEFANAIGTNRQTLHRMFANENVSMNLYFKALERIHDDQEEAVA